MILIYRGFLSYHSFRYSFHQWADIQDRENKQPFLEKGCLLFFGEQQKDRIKACFQAKWGVLHLSVLVVYKKQSVLPGITPGNALLFN